MKILQTAQDLAVAQHLVWYQRIFGECPVKVMDIKPEIAEIFEQEMMKCLEREVDDWYATIRTESPVGASEPSPGPEHAAEASELP